MRMISRVYDRLWGCSDMLQFRLPVRIPARRVEYSCDNQRRVVAACFMGAINVIGTDAFCPSAVSSSTS